MSSVERTFQTQIIAAPDSKFGNNLFALKLESNQQTLHIELEVTKPYVSAILGLVLELTKQTFTNNQSLLSEQSTTLDINQIRAKRREQFSQTGFVPPIAGGSPRKLISAEEERQNSMVANIANTADSLSPEISAQQHTVLNQKSKDKEHLLVQQDEEDSGEERVDFSRFRRGRLSKNKAKAFLEKYYTTNPLRYIEDGEQLGIVNLLVDDIKNRYPDIYDKISDLYINELEYRLMILSWYAKNKYK